MADKTKYQINITIEDLIGGGVQEKINQELEKIFENIHDPNVKADIVRKFTLVITMKPDDNRELIDVDVDFSSKLAPIEGLKTRFITDRDLKSNTIVAQEFKSNQRGQTYVDDNGELRTDTGDPIDVVEREMREKESIQNNIRQLKKGNE